MDGRIADALERIAVALERQADNDPLALLSEALADAPKPIELAADVHSLGGGRWVATVRLSPVVPGWSLDVAPDGRVFGGVRVTLVGPDGVRRTLRADDDA